MDRVHFSKRGLHPESTVETYVGALIMTCGYHAIIYDLISAVHQLAQASLANPQDIATHRDFTLWANAVRAAILKHGDLSAFGNRVNDYDRSLAAQMGILLVQVHYCGVTMDSSTRDRNFGRLLQVLSGPPLLSYIVEALAYPFLTRGHP